MGWKIALIVILVIGIFILIPNLFTGLKLSCSQIMTGCSGVIHSLGNINFK